MENNTEVEVLTLLNCDLCLKQNQHIEKAVYDCKTTFGSWAHLCQYHFDNYGIGLGLGKGQKLVVKNQ